MLHVRRGNTEREGGTDTIGGVHDFEGMEEEKEKGKGKKEKKKKYPRRESNSQSSDPESDALSIRPRGLKPTLLHKFKFILTVLPFSPRSLHSFSPIREQLLLRISNRLYRGAATFHG